MSIGDMVRRVVAARIPRDPEPEVEFSVGDQRILSDLLNGPHTSCGCEGCT